MAYRGLTSRTAQSAVRCFVAVLVCSATAAADDVTWVGTDFPPMAMSQGPNAHEGYIDAMYRFLRESSPQHVFREEIVPWTRALNMAKSGGPYCLLSALQTPEREAYLRFSAPYAYLFPIGVVIRATDQAQFAAHITKAGDFQLAEVIQKPEFGMGVASSRSYGPRIDSVLNPLVAAGAKHVHRVHQDESTKYLLSMLEAKRFDYMLAYPSEVGYYASTAVALRFYPIEGNNDLVAGRLSCTKSPQTDRVFADVSALVPTAKSRAVVLAAYERWLPKYLIAPYRQRLQALWPATP